MLIRIKKQNKNEDGENNYDEENPEQEKNRRGKQIRVFIIGKNLSKGTLE